MAMTFTQFGAVNDVKLVLAAGARRNLALRPHLEDAEIPRGFDSMMGQGLIIYDLDLRFARIATQICDNDRVNRKSKIVNSEAFFLRRPALFHQLEQVSQRFLVGSALLFGQLARAFVELRGHLRATFPPGSPRQPATRPDRSIHP